MNQSQLSVTETKPESEVFSELEAVALSELEAKDEVVSEPEAVVVCEPEVIQMALVSVDVESEPEIMSRFSSEIGPITERDDADVQKEMKVTEVDAVNSADVEPPLGTKVSMESESLVDADSIAEREEIAESKTELNKFSEKTPELDQPEGVASVDILEKQIENDMELDQALEAPKEETQNTFEISVIEKHVEVSAKTEEGIAASTSPDAQECSGEVFSFVQEIPLSRFELECFPLKSQEDIARKEQVVSCLDEEKKEELEASLLVKETEASPLVEEGLSLTVVEKVTEHSSANVAESEDGLIDESPMSEQQRVDDAALSMIVEVGSVYTDSDLQELEDGRHPPIGMEVGSFDDQDYISRPTSPDVDYACLKEQDIGDNHYIEQEQFSEEKFGVPEGEL